MAEPGKIEVQLSLLSGADTAAAKDLAESIKQIAESFKWLKSSNYQQSADALSRLYKTIEESHERVTKMVIGNSPGSGGGASRLNADVLGSAAEVEAARERERQQALKDKLRADADERGSTTQSQFRNAREEGEATARRAREAQERAERERKEREEAQQRVQAQRDADRAAQQQREEGRRQRVDDWMGQHGVRAEVAEGDGGVDLRGGWRIPRFGQLNLQDFINRYGRDRNLRKMLETDDPDEIQDASQRASFWQRQSDRAGTAYAIRHFMQGTSQWATRQGVNPMDFANAGAQLGFARNNTGWSEILGMQTPWSAAGEQGRKQAADLLNLRWQAGINNEQAQAIVGTTAGAGFSGNLGRDINMRLMAPLVRRYGANPQDVAPFLQTLRTGTASIDDLNRVLGDMGEAAQAAHLNLRDYNRELAASVEATQAMGGSALRGAEFGRTFMVGTGLPASVGNQVSQNPLVQSFTAAATGVPAMAQGALPAGQRMAGMRAAVNTITAQYQAGFRNAQARTREVLDPRTGEVVGTEAPGNLAMGAAAGALGFESPDALSKFMATEKRQAGVESFQVGTQDFNRQVRTDQTSTRRRGERREAILEQVAKNEQGGLNKIFGGGPGAEDYYFDKEGNVRSRDEGHKLIADRSQVGKMAHDWAVEQHGGSRKNKHSEFGELRRRAKDLGVEQEDLDKVKKGDTRSLRRLVSEAQREKEASYEIAMTPLTKKFFKVLANEQGEKVDWNLDSRNSAAASPPGPSPLSPRTNTGAGPVHGGGP